ncbi:MAG: response regulator [Leptospiraceae bacterium]|nr:response regulator [Leptospiraceae bacterium]
MSDSESIQYNILIIDHDDAERNNMRDILTARGYAPTMEKHAYNSEKNIARTTPELIIIALEMPRLDGTILVRKLRNEEQLKETPIIMIAAAINKEQLAELQKLNVRDFLIKPIQADKLLKAVEKYYRVKVIAELSRDDS